MQYELHVGGFKSFWNPQMKTYLTGFRNGFGILDLSLAHCNLKLALKVISIIVSSNKKILFIGGPAGLEKTFSSFCNRLGHYYLDNFDDGFFTNFSRKDKELFNISSLQDRPSLVFIFEVSKNEKVRKDILTFNIPVMAFVGTNDSVQGIDYPIPVNVSNWKGGLFVYNLLVNVLSIK